MVKRHSGKILIVSSQPNPFGSVYGATKAYELLLAESLSGELINSGVTISALCPGPTKTEFATRAGKKMLNLLWMLELLPLQAIRE